jgi:hypothetical protein
MSLTYFSKFVYIAVEVWVDVLGFVKRIQLARTVSLTNRHIHQICWPRLHGNKVVAHAVLTLLLPLVKDLNGSAKQQGQFW